MLTAKQLEKQIKKLQDRLYAKSRVLDMRKLKEIIPENKKLIGTSYQTYGKHGLLLAQLRKPIDDAGTEYLDENWWQYTKIIGVDEDGDFICNVIDALPDGTLNIRERTVFGGYHGSSANEKEYFPRNRAYYQPISAEDFNFAWQEAIKRLKTY